MVTTTIRKYTIVRQVLKAVLLFSESIYYTGYILPGKLLTFQYESSIATLARNLLFHTRWKEDLFQKILL
jgi:hypothetical protein